MSPLVNKPKSVLIVSPCKGSFGGLEAFALAIADGIASLPGFTVKVLFKRTSDFSPQDNLLKKIDESGLSVLFCNRASPTLWKEITNADLVHLQNLCPDVALFSRVSRKLLLITVHARKRCGTGLYQMIWSATLGLAHQRFYISEFVRRTWERKDRPWLGSEVVHSICELSSLEPLPIECRKGFVFISRWIENKGLDTLVEAYYLSGLDPEEWPLYLLGDGPLRPRVLSRLRELGLADLVHTPGFVSSHQKAEYIRKCRFAVIPPNTQEDFGLVALEARQLGLPCLITRDGGLPEAAGIHALSCDPGDVEGLKLLLLQAAEMNNEDYYVMAAAAHESLEAELIKPAFYAMKYEQMITSKSI